MRNYCTEDGCDRPLSSRLLGLCNMHARRRVWSKTPEARAKHAAYQKLRRERNGGYTENERNRRRIAQQRRRALDPEKTRAEKQLRRLGYNRESREYAKLLLKGLCAYCPAQADTIDHIIPLAKGGTHDWFNLAPACRSCNAKKGTKDLLQFLTERPL